MDLWLIDSSVWSRTTTNTSIRERVLQMVIDNEVATCTPIMLEMFRSARDFDDYVNLKQEVEALHFIAITPAIEQRALEVQAELVRTGQHRGVGRTDLIAAACAESADAILLHHDRDYDLIAKASGQKTEWAQG